MTFCLLYRSLPPSSRTCKVSYPENNWRPIHIFEKHQNKHFAQFLTCQDSFCGFKVKFRAASIPRLKINIFPIYTICFTILKLELLLRPKGVKRISAYL